MRFAMRVEAAMEMGKGILWVAEFSCQCWIFEEWILGIGRTCFGRKKKTCLEK